MRRIRNLGWRLRRVGLARPAIAAVTLAAMAAFGLLVSVAAIGETPAQEVFVSNGETYTISTVTGPGGTTTVAMTKTKKGKTKIVPIRLTRTLTGPGGTESVVVAVAGPRQTLTETDRQTLTQIQTQVNTVTNIVTAPPVTVTDVQTVTDVRTITEVLTETVTETVTVTVEPPP